MKLTIILLGAALVLAPAALLAQEDDQPQITPRPKSPTGAVGPTAVPQNAPDAKPAASPAKKAAADPAAQDTPQLIVQNPPAAPKDDSATPETVTVPAGTKIPLTLKQGINTKSAHVGDPVYAQTAFPITRNDHIVIPAGTFVQGEIQRVERPGRVKGRAHLLMSFNSLIYPNGYTVVLPGAVHGTPGSPDNDVKGQEGTIEGGSHKGKDVGTIAATTIPGAGIGAIAGEGKGAAIGAGAGAAVGLATVLFTRGPEIQLNVGDSIEMVLERSLTLTEDKIPKLVIGPVQAAQYQ
jgi:Bacterial conjugation TrbI-like protein